MVKSTLVMQLEADVVKASPCPECEAEADTPCTENGGTITAFHATRYAQYMKDQSDVASEEEDDSEEDLYTGVTPAVLILTASQLLREAALSLPLNKGKETKVAILLGHLCSLLRKVGRQLNEPIDDYAVSVEQDKDNGSN